MLIFFLLKEDHFSRGLKLVLWELDVEVGETVKIRLISIFTVGFEAISIEFIFSEACKLIKVLAIGLSQESYK